MSVLPPERAGGRIELLLSGVTDLTSMRVEVQPPAGLRIGLPGRSKKLKVTIPQATLDQAAAGAATSASSRAVLVGTGSRVKRTTDGKVRLMVSVVWG
jgi:hypothetical protein